MYFWEYTCGFSYFSIYFLFPHTSAQRRILVKLSPSGVRQRSNQIRILQERIKR
jgi:hypothetical protein